MVAKFMVTVLCRGDLLKLFGAYDKVLWPLGWIESETILDIILF